MAQSFTKMCENEIQEFCFNAFEMRKLQWRLPRMCVVYALRHIFNLIRSDKISKRSYISTVNLSQYLSGMIFQNSEHVLFQPPQSPFFIISRLQKVLSRMLHCKNYIHVDSNFVIDFSVSDTQLSRLWAKQCCKKLKYWVFIRFPL